MKYETNQVICKCKNVTFGAIENALKQHTLFSDVESEFAQVQLMTSCSTGCGGCHDKIMDIISEIMNGK